MLNRYANYDILTIEISNRGENVQENKITVDGKDILIKSHIAKNKQYVLIDVVIPLANGGTKTTGFKVNLKGV